MQPPTGYALAQRRRTQRVGSSNGTYAMRHCAQTTCPFLELNGLDNWATVHVANHRSSSRKTRGGFPPRKTLYGWAVHSQSAHHTAYRVRDLRDTTRGDCHARIRNRSTRARPRRNPVPNHEREEIRAYALVQTCLILKRLVFFRASRAPTCELNTWPTREYLVPTSGLPVHLDKCEGARPLLYTLILMGRELSLIHISEPTRPY